MCVDSIHLIACKVWLTAVPPWVRFAGWLFGGMDSKPLLAVRCFLSCQQIEIVPPFVPKNPSTSSSPIVYCLGMSPVSFILKFEIDLRPKLL